MSCKKCNYHFLCIPGPIGPTGPSGSGTGGFNTTGPTGQQGPTGSFISPLPSSSQMLYVQKSGSDITGDGTIGNPYLTIAFAMTTITDSSTNKRYVMNVGPGTFSDNFSWVAWVFMVGASQIATRLTGNIDINNPTWGIPGPTFDERAGATDIQFSGTITLDFTLQSSQYGKFYFWNCNVNNTLNITAQGPINQVICQDGLWFGGVSTNGGQLVFNAIMGQAGNIILTTSPTTLVFSAFCGALNGNLIMNDVGGVTATAYLFDFPILGNITLNGANVSLFATNSSLPLKANVTIAGGATLTRLTDAASLEYSPTTPSDWALPLPSTVQEALDRLASVVAILNGGPITFTASSDVSDASTPFTLTGLSED